MRATSGHAATMLVGLLCGSARAQPMETGGWMIEVIGAPVSPTHPTTTVRVSARFPTELWAFFGSRFDIVGSDPTGLFFDIMIPAPLGPLPPGSYGCFAQRPGIPIAGGIDTATFAQLNGIAGCIGDPTNPLPVWEARWTTDDFTPRTVRLETAKTHEFYVYLAQNWTPTVDLVATNQFRHGSAFIEVTSECYADCDTSTGVGVLDIFDFLCFQNLFAAADPYACDCDTSTGPGVCDVFDFLCYQGRYAAGCP